MGDIEMKRFTWIKKGNEVYQFDNAYEVKNDDTSCGIVMDNLTGEVIVNKGNPITWPTDATSGLQAIVDVKAGTLRFGMNNGPISRNEFVVSEYVEPFVPFVSVEDSTPVVGTKHDHGKPILGAVPPHAELAVGRVLTFGAEKYARGNWDKVEDHENRYMDAALRHLNAHRRGELTDSESGESHLAHAACCIMFMLDKQERGNK